VRALLAQWHPALRLDHVETDWDGQYDLVRSGAVDVAVVHDIGPVDGLRLDRVLDTGRWAVVPAGSPLAGAARLTEADVGDAQWVRLVGRHPGLADWAGPAGSSGSTSTVVRSPAAVPAAVATSGQLGVHGEPARRFFPHPGVRYVPLAGPAALVSVASREGDERPAVRAFREAARAVVVATESIIGAGAVPRDRNRNGE